MISDRMAMAMFHPHGLLLPSHFSSLEKKKNRTRSEHESEREIGITPVALSERAYMYI
jgi:hypothetical protein